MAKTRSARSSWTVVSFSTLSMSLRPTRAYTGVVRPSHKLDNQGVSSGTGIIHRRSPRWRAYSFMMSAYDTRSAPPISKMPSCPRGRSIAASK